MCNAHCAQRDDREDLAQEILVQLWRSFGAYDKRCRFSTWMYRIALNVAISFYRRERTLARPLRASDEDGLKASRRLMAKHPVAALYGLRIGYNAVDTIGGVLPSTRRP